MKTVSKIKKVVILSLTLFVLAFVCCTSAFAEEVYTGEVETVITNEPETAPPQTEPETLAPETEPETFEPETAPPETEPVTEPETAPPQTEPETAPPETEPQQQETQQVETQPVTYDVNQLPTLVDSTQVAEDLPTAIGADTNSGGVSMIGGVVCWISVGVAVAVILACLLSTRGRNKTGIGRFDSGNKFGSSYGRRYR